VRVLVEMLKPVPDPARGITGRVYDPCCGSGGMFVQSEKFVAEHGGRIGDIAIYGQESNYTTWRLAKMNLACAVLIRTSAGTTRAASTRTSCATSRPTSSSPTRRSTSPTGAASACAKTCAGSSACRR
jgi:Type I restriction-modification system methyltransferase subunit